MGYALHSHSSAAAGTHLCGANWLRGSATCLYLWKEGVPIKASAYWTCQHWGSPNGLWFGCWAVSGKVRMQLGERRCYVQALVLSHSAEWQDVGSNCNSAPRYKENCVCVPPNVRDHPLPHLPLQSLLAIAATLLFPESWCPKPPSDHLATARCGLWSQDTVVFTDLK